MIAELLRRLENGLAGTATPSEVDSLDVERVAALLLIEVARADQSIDATELKTIGNAVASISSMPKADIDALVQETIADADASVSLHAHLRLINDRFDKSARIALVENMWRVAYADGDLDKYEEHRIRSLSELLYVKHREFMQAKHRAQQAHSGT